MIGCCEWNSRRAGESWRRCSRQTEVFVLQVAGLGGEAKAKGLWARAFARALDHLEDGLQPLKAGA